MLEAPRLILPVIFILHSFHFSKLSDELTSNGAYRLQVIHVEKIKGISRCAQKLQNLVGFSIKRFHLILATRVLCMSISLCSIAFPLFFCLYIFIIIIFSCIE